MTTMNETLKDALTEMINIAFSRAAAALSELTGQRVLLDVPRIKIHPIEELQPVLSDLVEGEVATVHQIFSGAVSGDAFLILDEKGAMVLIDLLTGATGKRDRLFESDNEVLNEVGNILLNACLGSFGNMLKVHIRFSVPRVRLDAIEGLVASLSIGNTEVQYALIVFTDFRVSETDIAGFLIIVLGVSSLDLLFKAVDTMG